uniref:Uncharacterized protein n=1 Tax=Rhizophora mucronata TaxID=61149 RepID=A0A2P2J4E3_RHIMU
MMRASFFLCTFLKSYYYYFYRILLMSCVFLNLCLVGGLLSLTN